MVRKGLRPRIAPGFERPGARDAHRIVFPFRRSWLAIGILAGMDLIFMVPAFTTFQQAAGEWGRLDTLFDLVGAVFLSAWLLGWSLAPLLLTGALLLMLFGREVLRARPGTVEVFLGLPGIGLRAEYDASRMRNLRLEQPAEQSGKAWRGAHLAFDYGGNTITLGSALDSVALSRASRLIETGTGARIRRGDARAEELREAGAAVTDAPASEPPAAAQDDAARVSIGSPSALLLVVANLVPVAGAAFLGWRLSDVMVLYWAESAVIGLFNLCKIAVIGRWAALFAGPFFVGHFGGFMAVHFLFIYTLFVAGPDGAAAGDGELAEVWGLFARLWPALLALLVSHAYSFFANFLGRQEYRGRTVKDQMSEPYVRIIFMHLVLIFGGGLSLVLGGPTLVLLIVIALKIVFDMRAHLAERQRKSGG